MKVLFMGTPAFAAASLQAILDAGHTVVAAVTRPDAPSGRGLRSRPPAVKQVAQARGIPVLQPVGKLGSDLLERTRAFAPDILIVVAFGRILPGTILEVAPRGAVNLHASLLPSLRGASPIAWAIARGDTVTGVTTMRMVERVDAGDILLQRSTPIAPEETAGQLESRLAVMGAALLVETLAGIEAGTISHTPQDESLATWAPSLSKQDGVVDWALPAESIALRVRAFDPWPGARTRSRRPGGPSLRIWRARAIDMPVGSVANATSAQPGTVIAIVRQGEEGESGLAIACGQGTALLVTELQPEGRRRMHALEAISGRYIGEADRLGGE